MSDPSGNLERAQIQEDPGWRVSANQVDSLGAAAGLAVSSSSVFLSFYNSWQIKKRPGLGTVAKGTVPLGLVPLSLVERGGSQVFVSHSRDTLHWHCPVTGETWFREFAAQVPQNWAVHADGKELAVWDYSTRKTEIFQISPHQPNFFQSWLVFAKLKSSVSRPGGQDVLIYHPNSNKLFSNGHSSLEFVLLFAA